MEPLFLSKDEIAELTGYKVPALQCRWLKDRGWVFEQNCVFRVIVTGDFAGTWPAFRASVTAISR